ncbi:hypothetical protein LDENG_00012680, partial [Lucifuga dentata]
MPPAFHPEPRLPPPERYGGEEGTCRPFLTQCSLIFELQPSSYPTERSRVAYAISLLTSHAREWATHEWDRGADCCMTFQAFADELRKVFDASLPGREKARNLLGLRQGGRCVSDYAIEFRTLAAESKWNSFSLLDAFYHSLSDYIKDELVTCEPCCDLNALITLSTRLDNRFRARLREKGSTRSARYFQERRSPPVGTRLPAPNSFPASSPTHTSSTAPETMQIGRTRLTSEERQRHIQQHCCL